MFSKCVKRLRSVRSGSGRNDVPQLREDLEYLRWLVTHIRHRPSTTNFKRRTTEEVVQAMMSEPSELTDNESAGEDEETQIDVDDTEDGSVDKGNKKQEESAIEITSNSGEVDQAGPMYSPSGLDDEVGSITTQSPAPTLELAHVANTSACSTSPTTSVMDAPKNKNVTTSKSLPSVTAKPKKKAWSKESKPCNTGEIDREFLNTMNSIQKAIVEPTTVHKPSGSDDDEHFCLSLVGPLKSLEPRYKSMAKLQIMKVFNDIEWHKDPYQQAQHHQLPSGHGHLSMNQSNAYHQFYQPIQQPQHFSRSSQMVERSFSQEMQIQDSTREKEYVDGRMSQNSPSLAIL